MTNCQPLSSYREDTLVITKDNVGEIIPDNFDLSPGTQVTVKCNQGYTVVGPATFSCSTNGQWSYSTKPYCSIQQQTPEQQGSGVLDEDTKIMIGVVCGIAALIVIALIIMIIAICFRDRRRRRERREFWNEIRDERGPDYRGRDGPSTIDMEMYARSPRALPPPPPYDGRRNPGYRDFYDDIKKSRRSRSFDDLSAHEKKPYVRDWVKRSSQLGRDDEFLDRSGVYGRHSRDSYVWRDNRF